MSNQFGLNFVSCAGELGERGGKEKGRERAMKKGGEGCLMEVGGRGDTLSKVCARAVVSKKGVRVETRQFGH